MVPFALFQSALQCLGLGSSPGSAANPHRQTNAVSLSAFLRLPLFVHYFPLVEFIDPGRVFADDFSDYLFRQMPETLLDRLPGVWEDSVLVRVVGPPHDVVDAYTFDLVQGNEFLLERRIALPFPVKSEGA